MKRSVLFLCGGLVLLLIMLIAVPGGGRPSDFSLFLGRFHPVVVHLPIGILLVALILEALQRWTALKGRYESVMDTLVYIGFWSAIVAVIAGLYLARGGGYDPRTLLLHKMMGILVVVVAAFAYIHRAWPELAVRMLKQWMERAYSIAAVALLLVVALAGHFGGQLTHGSDYLTRYLPDGLRQLGGLPPKAELGKLALDNPAETTVYAALIAPVLDARCTACHGARSSRGGLRLDSQEGIEEGGDDGPPVVAGRASESEMIHRIWLPLYADGHMPPEGSPQVSVAEAELIRWWIDDGASFEALLPDAEFSPSVQAILDGMGLDEIRTGIFALDTDPADSLDILQVRQLGLAVTPLAENEPYLQVRCTDPSDCSGQPDLPDALGQIAPNVAWLDLSRSDVDDSFLATVEALPHLTRLYLQQSAVTDAGMHHLGDLEYLEYLNLYGTAVTDSGLTFLAGLPNLKSLYLWQTEVTDAGVEALQAAMPDLYINTGLSLEPVVTDTTEAE